MAIIWFIKNGRWLRLAVQLIYVPLIRSKSVFYAFGTDIYHYVIHPYPQPAHTHTHSKALLGRMWRDRSHTIDSSIRQRNKYTFLFHINPESFIFVCFDCHRGPFLALSYLTFRARCAAVSSGLLGWYISNKCVCRNEDSASWRRFSGRRVSWYCSFTAQTPATFPRCVAIIFFSFFNNSHGFSVNTIGQRLAIRLVGWLDNFPAGCGFGSKRIFHSFFFSVRNDFPRFSEVNRRTWPEGVEILIIHWFYYTSQYSICRTTKKKADPDPRSGHTFIRTVVCAFWIFLSAFRDYCRCCFWHFLG